MMTGNPLPIQSTEFSKEDFRDDERVHALNQYLKQIVNAVNAGNGTTNRVVVPAGIDVNGGTVTGIGAPQGPTDAVSQEHVATTYGAPTLQPQLDIGGKNALKGLTYLYGQQTTNAATTAAVTASTYTPGNGYITLFGLIIQFGFVANMDTASFPMNFPVPFPTACISIVVSTTGPTDRITYISSFSATQFTFVNNGTGAGATWIAVGY